MVCESRKIDSNITGLSFAEEECLKELPDLVPDSGDQEGAVWFGLEPNSYSDFGGEIATVARSPIDPSRQNKKGTITDNDASGGFNQDFTQTNFQRLLQGFFFADIREKPTTKPMNSLQLAISAVTAASDTYTVGTSVANFNKAGYLVKATGFGVAANNGVKVVVSATATTVVVGDGLVDEASPPVAAKLEVVGFQAAAADLNIAVVGGVPSLISTALNFTTLGLNVGEWIFIGGDTLATNRFANNVGFARIASIAATALVFDDTDFAAVNETGTGKTIRIFFGSVLRNEKDRALIKRRSYQLERLLGEGATDTQAEYLIGAVANEFTLNIPQADKFNADVSFVACDNIYRSGEIGDEIKPGTRVNSPGEDAFNTSLDVRRLKMSIVDPASAAPPALFAYVSEATVSISNGVTPNKAVGVLGAFDTSAGNFVVGGSITAYFKDVEAIRAVRNNADVQLNVSVAAKNAGFIFDIPLLGLGGGRLNVEKDSPITVPLEPAGAENKNGYTLMYNYFSYLPNVAMPQA